jgi:hypothetical protein
VRSRSSRRHPPIQRSAIAFMRGVRTSQSTVQIPASARTMSNAGREVRAAVADHELDPVRLLAEVHDQVAGVLGGPLWMQSDSEDAWLPPLHYGELMAQDQDLCGLPCLRTPGQPQP